MMIPQLLYPLEQPTKDKILYKSYIFLQSLQKNQLKFYKSSNLIENHLEITYQEIKIL